MKEHDDLSFAIAFAAEAHDGQTDKAGEPYILHPLRVMLAQTDPTARIVGVLHGAVEDSNKFGLGDILALFGEDVWSAVDAVTRREGEDYFTYVERAGSHPVMLTFCSTSPTPQETTR